ncbi:unnamed protein product [Dibothriocephalus latus]|uniref:Uncharacterized protein n=1 Tax=Dibothriocephalus latus TaxID=60516 RepID=A0A3P7NB53_DIBLA|nr:unnamed protein product [Dibothriocephalus latus]
MAWEQVNDRVAYVRLKGHFTAADQQDKDNFYSQLQELVERLPRRDLLIVTGD